MQLNFTNFIRFFTGDVEDQSVNIPRLALIDSKCYCPVFVPGERASFYINASVPFLDGDDINNLELRILNPDGTVASNLGVIMQRVTLTNGYRMYADFIFPDLPNKQYQFQVFNTTTNTAKCISNWFWAKDETLANEVTAYVVWRNSRSAYYYDWALYPDFYCRIRLHLSLQSYTPEGTVEQIQSVNTGRRRNLNRVVDKSVRLQTYYFDDGANDACIALFEADDISINGKKYLAKTIYNPNARPSSKVSTGEIELFEQDFSSVNKYGQLPQELTNSGYVAFLNKSNTIFSIKAYNENNVLFSSIDVPVNGSLFYPIGNIPYNGNIKFVGAAVANRNVLTMKSINNTAEFNESSNSNAVTATLSRGEVYNTDWTIVIS
jgi:hypothetical protein